MTKAETAIHELKTWPEYFEKVLSGEKNFELRKNDRNYQEGDILVLREWKPRGFNAVAPNERTGEYTGREIQKRVSYILSNVPVGFGLMNNYCILGLEEYKAQPLPVGEGSDGDYQLIPMTKITDEARMIAVRWMECEDRDWIGQKHKLASDIMNYARRQDQQLQAENTRLREQLQQAAKNQQFASEFMQRVSTECNHLRDALKEITLMDGNEETLRQAAKDYLEELPAQASQSAADAKYSTTQMLNDLPYTKPAAPPAAEAVPWTPVSEQLPENMEKVLCCTHMGSIVVNSYCLHTDQDDKWFKERFSFWMPLPSAPATTQTKGEVSH